MSQWYYGSPAGQSGPVEEHQLRQMIAAGQLVPETLVWRDGMTDWVRLDAVPELSSPQAGSYGPPQAYPGYPPGYYPPAAPTNGLAIASLVCGILAVMSCHVGGLMGLPAVICGHMALSAIRNSAIPMGGRGMAIAGLVMGYLGILFSLCAVVFFLFFFSQARYTP
jgi:hypothetical protein